MKKQTLDRLDVTLIRELENDGRQTNTALAKKLGTSKATVRRRLKRLLDEGVIKVIAAANPLSIGYRTMATVGINTRPDRVDAVAERLLSYSSIKFVAICMGRYDIIVWAVFRTPEELSSFLRNELGKIPGMARIETLMNLEVKKRTFTYLSEAG